MCAARARPGSRWTRSYRASISSSGRSGVRAALGAPKSGPSVEMAPLAWPHVFAARLCCLGLRSLFTFHNPLVRLASEHVSASVLVKRALPAPMASNARFTSARGETSCGDGFAPITLRVVREVYVVALRVRSSLPRHRPCAGALVSHRRATSSDRFLCSSQKQRSLHIVGPLLRAGGEE